MKESSKRGWLLDQLMLIGHYEAELTHDDEQIINIKHDMAQNSGSLEEIEKLTDELNFRRELEAMHYQGRTLAEQDVFEAFPELELDKKKWCDIKHQCAIYILACETYHARDGHPTAEDSMVLAGKQLVFLVSHTFGFEPMDCARCFNDALNAKLSGSEQDYMPPTKEIDEEPQSEIRSYKLAGPLVDPAKN